jgi:hypothetical protein
VVLAVAVVLLAIAIATSRQERTVDFGSDPMTEIARQAHGAAVTPSQINRLRARIERLERRGTVDGMVFRTQYAEALAEQSVGSVGAWVAFPSTPSITVDVPQGGGLIEAYMETEIHVANVTKVGYVELVDSVDFPPPVSGFQIMASTGAAYEAKATGQGATNGVSRGALGGPVRYFAPTPGKHTLSLYGEVVDAGNVVYLRNVRLWVGVARAGT